MMEQKNHYPLEQQVQDLERDYLRVVLELNQERELSREPFRAGVFQGFLWGVLLTGTSMLLVVVLR